MESKAGLITALKALSITRLPWRSFLALANIRFRNLSCITLGAYMFTSVKGIESSVHTKIRKRPCRSIISHFCWNCIEPRIAIRTPHFLDGVLAGKR